MKKSSKKINYTYAIGRRKEASARIRLYRGKGESTVNSKPAEKYFGGEVFKKILAGPFGVTETSGKYYYSARINGGGKNGQVEALVLGISRALAKISADKFKPLLRKFGFLTRDSRVRQRRMIGTGGKARREKQSPKR